MALVACSMGLLPRPSLLKIFCVVLWWTNTKPLVEVTQIKWLATNTSPLCTWPMCETLITPSRWLNKEDFTPRFTPIGWFGGDWPPKWRIKANNVSVTKRKNMLLVSVEDSSLPKVCCSASCDRLMRQTPGVQFQVVWTCFEQHDSMSTTSQCSNQLSEHDSSSARYWNSAEIVVHTLYPGTFSEKPRQVHARYIHDAATTSTSHSLTFSCWRGVRNLITLQSFGFSVTLLVTVKT